MGITVNRIMLGSLRPASHPPVVAEPAEKAPRRVLPRRRETAALPAPRPRVALVAPGPGVPGGQESQATALERGLRQEGYRVLRLRIDPIFPSALAWVRRHRYARTLVNQALYLSSLPCLRRRDVAHVFSASYWSFLLSAAPALLAGRILGKRVILHYHSGEADDHLAHWGLLVHPWLALPHAIVVPSEYLKNVFERHGYLPRVIPNVVDLSRFRYRERASPGPRFLCARTLDPYYRVDQTLRAFALLKERFPDATLSITGGGTEEGRLRHLASSLGLGGVRFLGPVDPMWMPAVYDGADIFLNASVLDNQPVSVLEAFACGLPVISTGCGDLAALARDGKTALVVPPEDPAAMAEAATRLLKDPEAAVRMARRAREVAEEHSWPHVREAWAQVYTGRREK